MQDEGEQIYCKYCERRILRLKDESGRYIYCELKWSRFAVKGKVYRGFPLHQCPNKERRIRQEETYVHHRA